MFLMYCDDYGNIIQDKNAWTGAPLERTKRSHPYSYEPFTVWGVRTEGATGVYSDRMFQQSPSKFNVCCQEVWGNTGQYFDSRCPYEIEKFLQLYYEDLTIKLTWIVEDCNVSNGYPLWYFQFKRGE